VVVIRQESLEYEGAMSVPLIPYSTSDALRPNEARGVASALRAQASVYETAAAIAEARAAMFERVGYKCRAMVRQHDRPYNVLWRNITVEVRGVPEVEE
jgi:hypothetical protein